MLISASRSRDILECIASLSSDEVATPPAVANQVLDLLPVEVWSNKDLKWLDPACKTGVFLREAARRLMEGLKDSIPDETERRKHIFTNMLHGYALSELTAQMSRRSLYYNKDASSKKLSVVPFKREEGNIQFSAQDHPYNPDGKCNICGAGKEVFGAPGNRERHAYDFIHSEEGDMKFDVVVGNPPYQIEDGGAGASATPIYQHFVSQAFRLRPRYVSMIIPSRWFAGGKGLDSFRAQMLASRNFRSLDVFFDAGDLFPGVEIKGGVCYFLWDSQHQGPCRIVTHDKDVPSSAVDRYLNEHGDVFVPWNEAGPILEKILSSSPDSLESQVSAQKPFGFRTFFEDYSQKQSKNSIKIYVNGGHGFIDRAQVQQNQHWIDKWKVLTSKGYGAGEGFPHQILGQPIIAEPGSVCTETYIVCGVFDTQQEAESFASYYSTRIFRFLVALRKNTQDVNKTKFSFVPILDWDQVYSDEHLLKLWKITAAEMAFIESKIRLMPNAR
jgi:site-specific DNA-methyltransferase (adenine-specific)